MMNFAKFIIRLDDICPQMDWHNFLIVKKLLDKYQIQPIIGVIPNNRDNSLMKGEKNLHFWKQIRDWQQKGWRIAQHGFEHLYHTQNSGIFDINKRSEFAGLSYEVQLEKLTLGQEILEREGVFTDVFMAPSHSIDVNTIKALKETKFQYVTDGYGLYPYEFQGLIFVPQLFASPFNFGFGIYTICLHTNELTSSKLAQLEQFISKNATQFISFEESIAFNSNNFLNTILYSNFFKMLRKGKKLLTTYSHQ